MSTIINMDPENVSHEFLSYKFADIKRKYPELENIPFVDNLSEDVYFPQVDDVENSYNEMDNREIRNIFFTRHPDNPIAERDVFTANWRNLINFDPNKFNMKREYTSDEVKEISNFFNDLVYFSLTQSGLTNNSNGFSDLIPYEIWGRFISQAFANMKKSTDADSQLSKQMIKIFEQRIKQMNPNIKWGSTTKLLNKRDDEGRPIPEKLKMYKNYFRGKDYKFDKDDLGKLANLYNDEDDLEDVKAMTSAGEIFGNIKDLKEGSYITYNGEEWIVTKVMTKYGLSFQLFNPLRSGKKAIDVISGREIGNLIADKKADIVQLALKSYLITHDGRIIDLMEKKAIKPSKELKEKILASREKPNDDIIPPVKC